VGFDLFSSFTTQAACANTAAGGDGYILNIVLGTPQYVAANLSHDGGPPLTEPLRPGVYTLDNEYVSDQDLCMIDPGFDATLTEFRVWSDGGSTPLYNGVGTVTLDHVDARSLSGTLDARLESVDGIPGVDGGPLTGSFHVSVCP